MIEGVELNKVKPDENGVAYISPIHSHGIPWHMSKPFKTILPVGHWQIGGLFPLSLRPHGLSPDVRETRNSYWDLVNTFFDFSRKILRGVTPRSTVRRPICQLNCAMNWI